MQEYVNVAFLNARNDFRLFLYDLKDSSHLSRTFSTLRWSFFCLEIPFGLHGYSCSPDFPVKLPKGFTGSHYGILWVSFLASGGTFPHGPYICPGYLLFQRQPSLSLNTCQALHVYVFSCFILISQAIAAPLPDPWKFCSSSTHFLNVIFLELTPLPVGCNQLLSVYCLGT